VLQRRALEAFRPADAAEVVLVDGSGGLLEGLVSNFFVVAGVWGHAGDDTGRGARGQVGGARARRQSAAQANSLIRGTTLKRCCRPARSGAEVPALTSSSGGSGGGGGAPGPPPWLAGYELQTAAGGAQAVLPGIMQRRVLQAAAELGLHVREAPPRGEERGAWREAFIANWWARG
jgi:hypothetical protein